MFSKYNHNIIITFITVTRHRRNMELFHAKRLRVEKFWSASITVSDIMFNIFTTAIRFLENGSKRFENVGLHQYYYIPAILTVNYVGDVKSKSVYTNRSYDKYPVRPAFTIVYLFCDLSIYPAPYAMVVYYRNTPH